MFNVIFYTKENCLLCDNALDMLNTFQGEYSFTVEERDIYTNDEWLLAYQITIPVIEINGTQINCEQLDYDRLATMLENAKEKSN